MNDFHMMNLANDRIAERRADADRSRLVHLGHAENTTRRREPRTRRLGGLVPTLGSLLHRVAAL